MVEPKKKRKRLQPPRERKDPKNVLVRRREFLFDAIGAFFS